MIWRPDSCDCIIDCKVDMSEGSFIQRCSLHTESVFSDIIDHNKNINSTPNKTDEEIINLKKLEKENSKNA